MKVQVAFDDELLRSTIERLEPAAQSSTRLDLGPLTLWIDHLGITEMVVDEQADNGPGDSTIAVVEELFGSQVAQLVRQRGSDAIRLGATETAQHRELAAVLRQVDLDRLRELAPHLAELRDPRTDAASVKVIAPSSVAALVTIRFDVSNGDPLDAVDQTRPARVTWDRTSGELLVNLEVREDRAVPPGWWLRVVDGRTDQVVAVAPLQPKGVASTVVSPSHDPSALGLRVARGATDETFRREQAARDQLRVLESLAREAESLGDSAGASAAWATAAAFADEIFEDGAAAQFRQRSARERTRRRRKKAIVVALVLAAIAVVLAALSSGLSSQGDEPTRTTLGPIAASTTTAAPATTAAVATTTPPAPADASGRYSYLVGEALGPLFEEIGVELGATSVRPGESVTVIVTQVLDAPAMYPSEKYDECMDVIGEDRTVPGVQVKPTPTTFVLVPVVPGTSLTADLLAAGTNVSAAQQFAPILVTKVIRCGTPVQGSQFFGTADRLYMGAVAIELQIPDVEPGSYAVVPLGVNETQPSPADSDYAVIWIVS